MLNYDFNSLSFFFHIFLFLSPQPKKTQKTIRHRSPKNQNPCFPILIKSKETDIIIYSHIWVPAQEQPPKVSTSSEMYPYTPFSHRRVSLLSIFCWTLLTSLHEMVVRGTSIFEQLTFWLDRDTLELPIVLKKGPLDLPYSPIHRVSVPPKG